MSADDGDSAGGGVGADLFASLLDEVGEAVAVVAPGGRLAYANAAWRRYADAADEPAAAVLARFRALPHFRIRERPLADGSTAFLVRQDEDSMFREVLDSIDSTIAVYDHTERFRYANAAYCRLYPHQGPEHAGHTFEEMLRATLRARHFAEPQAQVDPEGYVRRRLAEFRNWEPSDSERLSPTGRWDLLRVRITPSGLRVSTRTEITEQKRLQEELRYATERLEVERPARARFVAKLSQDLRAPLGAVLGYAELIETEVMGPLGSVKYQEYAALIRQSGHRMLALIDELMKDTAEVCQAEMREAEIDLPTLLRGELSAAEGLARANRTQLTLILPSDLPYLRGDPRMVRQMASALLSNAVRHTVDGVVGIQLRRRADRGIDIEVSDSGLGMTPDVLARAGEPYFRGPVPPGAAEPGVGLGIAMVQDLLQLHQGWLTMTSTVGRGTVAILSFPAERSGTPAGGGKP